MNVLTCIKSFIYTVDEGSLTGAANKLYVSKSLVSRNIKNLEAHLNSRLMNRSTKSVALTDAGKHYYKEAKEIVSNLESLNDSLRFDSSQISGTLNVMAPGGLTEILLMNFFCEFGDRYPDLTLNLLLNDDLNSLSELGYDVAIRSGTLVRQDLDLIATSIKENSNVICASQRYLDRYPKLSEPSDLLRHRVIEDPNLKNNKVWRFECGKSEQHIKINPVMSVNSVQAIKKALLADYGVAMLPRELAEDELASGDLVEVLSEYELPSRVVYVLYRERVNTPEKVKVFITELKAYFTH